MRGYKVQRLGSLKGFRPITGHIGLTGALTGLASDDSPLMLRDAATQEIYALDWDAP